MKNLFAFNEINRLIHIKDVVKENGKKFNCCNCGNELIPRKGKIKAHHFSHKIETNCSYESYLHKLAKIKFFNKYSECLEKNEKFEIEFITNRVCNSCENIKNVNIVCEINDKISFFDLTKKFDKISIEKSFKGFIADILLESSKSEEKLFIEFVVTHKCEPIKINSGIRIVEINLNSESDLDFIENRKIDINNTKNTYHNFIVKKEINNYINPNQCKNKFEIFSISKNNKAIKTDSEMKYIINSLEKFDFKHYEILNQIKDNYDYEYGSNHHIVFINMVQKLAFQIQDFKNCFSCRFSTENNNKLSREIFGNTLFCKKLKCVLENSNDGHNCDKYWRIENPNKD